MTTPTPFTIVDSLTRQVLSAWEGYGVQALASAGTTVLEDIRYEDGWIDSGGVHRNVPAAPAAYSVWNWVAKAWQDPRTLAQAKKARIAAIVAVRDAAIATDKVTTVGTFKNDPAARLLLLQVLGVAQAYGARLPVRTTFNLYSGGPSYTLGQLQQALIEIYQQTMAINDRAAAASTAVNAASTNSAADSVAFSAT